MLKTLSEVIASGADFNIGWRSKEPNVALENPQFGRIEHAVVCDSEGSPLYDQPVWTERTGAICVAVDARHRIALLRQFRHVLTEPRPQADLAMIDLAACGRLSWELPRGFPEPGELAEAAATREVYEETDREAAAVEFLDYVNSNTSFFPHSNAVFLVRLRDDARHQAGVPGQPSQSSASEPIEEVRFLSLCEVLTWIRQGKIVCGLSRAAIASYVAWLAERQLLTVEFEPPS